MTLSGQRASLNNAVLPLPLYCALSVKKDVPETVFNGTYQAPFLTPVDREMALTLSFKSVSVFYIGIKSQVFFSVLCNYLDANDEWLPYSFPSATAALQSTYIFHLDVVKQYFSFRKRLLITFSRYFRLCRIYTFRSWNTEVWCFNTSRTLWEQILHGKSYWEVWWSSPKLPDG